MIKTTKMKIAIIGPPNVGKTAFICNLMRKPIPMEYTPTQSYEMYLYELSTSTNNYEIHLWDCGSQHLHNNKHIRSAFFRNCSAALLLFDLCQKNWKQIIPEWLEQAYQFDCFLVYAIGTKKDAYLGKLYKESCGETVGEQNLTASLLQKKGIETLDELQINNFFNQYQIRHFFQAATEKVHNSIKNIFLGINDDRQKLNRTSFAQARRFDNTVFSDTLQSLTEEQKSRVKMDNILSIKEEIYDQEDNEKIRKWRD